MSLHNISTDHIEIDIDHDPVFGHESATASKISNETPSSLEMGTSAGDHLPANNASSSRLVGERIMTRQSVRKIWNRVVGFFHLKSYDKDQLRSIEIPCISQVIIDWFYQFFDFVNTWNLEELVKISCDSQSMLVNGNESRLGLLKKILGDVKLTEHDRPSSLLVDLMRDVIFQLVDLHESGIIYGDLKPQNIVIIKGIRRLLCAKLSNRNTTSSSYRSTDCGLEDMSSLGCLLFFCITGGKHPFGDHHHDHYYRDDHIVENKVDLVLVEDFPEAHHLISLLLSPKLELRPKAIEVLHHPLLWYSVKRLSFLCDTSDLVKNYPHLLKELKAIKLEDIGANREGKLVTKWDQTMDKDIIKHMLKYRKYKFKNVLNLLRFIRNMSSHYKETPEDIKGLMIDVRCREDLDGYFTRRFPMLLMKVYEVVCTHCREEKGFEEYFKGRV